MPNSKTGKFFNRPPSAAASDDWATVISGVEGPLRIQPPDIVLEDKQQSGHLQAPVRPG